MSSVAPSRPLPTRWDEPPWDAPFDAPAALRAIPEGATMSGMFLQAVAQAAQAAGHRLPSAKPRYVAFHPHPLREHADLLLEASAAMFPRSSTREGLRRLGRGAPQALVQSISGKVVFGSVEGPVEILRAMAKSYSLHQRPGSLEVVVLAPGEVVVRVEEVHHFLDSHHVGVFEGVLRHAGVKGSVKICAYSRSSADLLCSFTGG
jgi:uncharacterized protein (TIGR02265 family)